MFKQKPFLYHDCIFNRLYFQNFSSEVDVLQEPVATLPTSLAQTLSDTFYTEQEELVCQLQATIKNLKDENLQLHKRIKTLDRNFHQAESLLLAERGGFVDRNEAVENILENLNASDLDGIGQLRTMVDRIEACHALEAPYYDSLEATVKLFYPERLFRDNVCVVDLDQLFSVIGNQYFLHKSMDFYIDFLNAQLPDTNAIVLKTSEYDQIVKSSECESIRKKVERFSKILVPLRMEEIDRAHWMLYSVNLCDNPPSIVCYDTIRRGRLNTRQNSGDQFFPDMEVVAARLFPNTFGEMDSSGKQ